MTEFVSEIKTIPYNEDRVYAMLSDLSNLERVKDRIPQDKIKDFEFDSDVTVDYMNLVSMLLLDQTTAEDFAEQLQQANTK